MTNQVKRDKITGKHLAKLIKRAGLTPADFARKLVVEAGKCGLKATPSYVNWLLSKETIDVRAGYITAIANVLNCSRDDLFTQVVVKE